VLAVGFVAGQEQRDGLIAKLASVMREPSSSCAAEQHREQVPGVAAEARRSANDAVENFLDLSHFPLYAQVRGRGQPVRNKNGPRKFAPISQQLLQ